MKASNFLIHFTIIIVIRFSICETFAAETVSPTEMQFVFSRINDSLNTILPRDDQKSDCVSNSAAALLTSASGRAQMISRKPVIHYIVKRSEDTIIDSYTLKHLKISDEKSIIIISVNEKSDGFRLYLDLLHLFAILEQCKSNLNNEMRQFDDNFKLSASRGCYNAEINIGKFFASEKGESWIRRIGRIKELDTYNKKLEMSYEVWSAQISDENQQIIKKIWNEVFSVSS